MRTIRDRCWPWSTTRSPATRMSGGIPFFVEKPACQLNAHVVVFGAGWRLWQSPGDCGEGCGDADGHWSMLAMFASLWRSPAAGVRLFKRSS